MPSLRSAARRPVETEAKIPVPSLAPVKRRLRLAGARLEQRAALETNVLFDRPGALLRQAGRSLRVRSFAGIGIITLKGPATARGGIKSRQELESAVASPMTVQTILKELGLVPAFRYEKYREVWELGAAVVCLDDTPLGAFVEIEGTVRSIERVARTLALDLDASQASSYPALWFASGRRGDMTFEKPRSPKGPRS